MEVKSRGAYTGKYAIPHQGDERAPADDIWGEKLKKRKNKRKKESR
jgi:hypothetical protein